MDTLNEIISVLRVVIIPLGTVFRVVFCFTKMIYDEDATATYKRKIRNTIVFGIIAELVFVIMDLVQAYYGGSVGGGGSTGGAGATRDF